MKVTASYTVVNLRECIGERQTREDRQGNIISIYNLRLVLIPVSSSTASFEYILSLTFEVLFLCGFHMNHRDLFVLDESAVYAEKKNHKNVNRGASWRVR